MIRVIVAAVIATVALAAPASAQTDNLADPTDVCVRADYLVRGSRWNLTKSVADWDGVQSAVHFRIGYDPGCADVILHRYISETDGRCGYTAFDRGWDDYTTEGIDIYLNDYCPSGRAVRKWVIAHELGHAIGLDHTTGIDSSVMSDTYQPDVYRGRPGPTDAANVINLYLEGQS